MANIALESLKKLVTVVEAGELELTAVTTRCDTDEDGKLLQHFHVIAETVDDKTRLRSLHSHPSLKYEDRFSLIPDDDYDEAERFRAHRDGFVSEDEGEVSQI